jgi:hypothetical protein
MNHETGRLVDDQNVRIFVEDIEGDVLRLDFERAGRRFVDDDVIPGVDGGRWFRGALIEQDVPTVDQVAGARAAPIGVELGQTQVEAGAFELFRNLELVP